MVSYQVSPSDSAVEEDGTVPVPLPDVREVQVESVTPVRHCADGVLGRKDGAKGLGRPRRAVPVPGALAVPVDPGGEAVVLEYSSVQVSSRRAEVVSWMRLRPAVWYFVCQAWKRRIDSGFWEGRAVVFCQSGLV